MSTKPKVESFIKKFEEEKVACYNGEADQKYNVKVKNVCMSFYYYFFYTIKTKFPDRKPFSNTSIEKQQHR
jgi:hypothetical protein